MYIPLYLIQRHVTHTKRKNNHVKGPVTKDRQETSTLNQIRLLLQNRGLLATPGI